MYKFEVVVTKATVDEIMGDVVLSLSNYLINSANLKLMLLKQ